MDFCVSTVCSVKSGFLMSCNGKNYMHDLLNSLLSSTQNVMSRRRSWRRSPATFAHIAQHSGRSSEVLETRTLLAAHLILSNAPAIVVAPGETVNVPIVYQTLNDNGAPAALKSDQFSFNLHFDADVLTWVSTSSVFTEGIQDTPNKTLAETDAIVVGDDLDNATETVLLSSYASAAGWPANPNVNGQTLYVARFTAKSVFSGSTIKFSANQTGSVIGQSSDFTFESFPVVLQAPAGTTLSIADAPAVTEGGDSVFNVSLSSAQTTAVTVQYSTEDGNGPTGASSAEDYTAQTNQTLTFNPGETQKTITIATTDDPFVEPQEAFRVSLFSPGPGGVTLGTAQAMGFINDNDVALPTVSIANAPSVVEGGNATFNVTLNRTVSGPVTITYSTADGNGPTGAVNGVDLTAQTNQVLTFAAGETQKTITVATIDDLVPESAEEFEVILNNATGATIANGRAKGTISDNDSDLPAFSIANAPAITEGNAAVFEVTLSKPASSALTVTYSTFDGTGPTGARAGADFVGQTNQTLTFAAGETEKTISVSTIDDALGETSETFHVTLSEAIGAAISNSLADGTIIDNDTIPTFPGDVDGDSDFDANDSFLIQLVKLSGTNTQIDQSKGTSTLTATQIRANVNQLASPGDVDGDSDFDANDSFLIQLVKLSGTNAQIDQSKGTSTLSAAQIRDNVNSLGGGVATSSVVSQGSEAAVMASPADSDGDTDLFSDSGQDAAAVSTSPAANTLTNDSSTSVWEDFRDWIDAI
ncbi:MAG TPA: hypothetical protein EYG03_20295 [Planctomycetes bacterium]|nr:hypothetical protein [Fuerstiella sp.]HIK94292.1 hypothetical protein [Planctomycetota bacterium]